VELVVAGASTGGPAALAAVLGALEGRAPWPVLVAQHITPGFTVGLARWLEASTGTAVRVVTAEAPLEPGRVYLASDGCHLELSGRWLRSVTDPGALNRPSVDRLFCSVAASPLASRTLAILLTGMGSDGALGTLRLAQAGARTIAQDAATSVVFGMPRAAVEAGGVSEVRSLTEIGRALAALAAGTVSRQR
jgi:two-component system chemotaxis response regulator CheB